MERNDRIVQALNDQAIDFDLNKRNELFNRLMQYSIMIETILVTLR